MDTYTNEELADHYRNLGLRAIERRYYDRFARAVVLRSIQYLRDLGYREDATFLRDAKAAALHSDSQQDRYLSGGYLMRTSR